MLESRHPLPKSFKFALDGLRTAVIKGRNFRIQLATGLIAVIVAICLQLDTAEWLDLTIVITLVLILELINTSLEEIVDLIQPEISDKAKVAKDVAAGAVFVASLSSVIIGAILFLPKILNLLSPR